MKTGGADPYRSVQACRELTTACHELEDLASALTILANGAVELGDQTFTGKLAFQELTKQFQGTLAKIVALSMGLSEA
jgi:hypothetical protein